MIVRKELKSAVQPRVQVKLSLLMRFYLFLIAAVAVLSGVGLGYLFF